MQITPTTSPQDLLPYIQKAFRAWHSNTPEHLLDFLALVRARRAQTPDEKSPAARRLMTNEVLLAALDSLASQDHASAELLRTRYLARKTILQAAFTFNLTEDQIKKGQRQALDKISEILLVREQNFREEVSRRFEAHLPPPTYSRLFGVERASEKLAELLVSPDGPWIIAVVGIGGLGKTALAHFLARTLVHDFGLAQIHWLQFPGAPGMPPQQTYANLLHQLADALGVPEGVPQTRTQQLRYLLKQTPYLILLDNLETDAETSYLLEQLSGLASPSKFIVTTRSFPAPQTGVYTHHLSELALPDATALLRSHSEALGLGNLALTDPSEAQAIYKLTGGNPLALKLVTGLVAIFPLPHVLNDLAQSRIGEIEDLYKHIYLKAWQALSQDAQNLLQAMPLVADTGARPDQLLAISGLSETQLWPALQTLVTRSLVEVQGTSSERRYGIHALTRTFLHTEIIHWETDDPA